MCVGKVQNLSLNGNTWSKRYMSIVMWVTLCCYERHDWTSSVSTENQAINDLVSRFIIDHQWFAKERQFWPHWQIEILHYCNTSRTHFWKAIKCYFLCQDNCKIEDLLSHVFWLKTLAMFVKDTYSTLFPKRHMQTDTRNQTKNF